MTNGPLIKQQLINYVIYTIVGVSFELLGPGGAGTSGILIVPIILFSILVFLFNLAFTFLGQSIFNKKHPLLALLTPQIIAAFLIGAIKIQRRYIIDYDFDKVLFLLLVLTTLLNIWTFIKLKQHKYHND